MKRTADSDCGMAQGSTHGTEGAGNELTIIGLTRYAVDPASIIEPGREVRSLEQLRAALYDPAYLRKRFVLFKTYYLPSMVAAARRHRRFHSVLFVSPDLPERHRLRLGWLSRRYSWLHIAIVQPGEDLLAVTRRTVAELGGAGRSFNFRLDNDDALNPAFIDRIAELSSTQEDGKVVSFDRGYYVQRVCGATFRVQEKHYPKNAQGLGMFSGPSDPACIFSQGLHTKIAADRVVNVTDRPYWLRTMHAYTDSGKRTDETPTLTLAEACEVLAPAFGHLTLETALMALPETKAVRADTSALRSFVHIQ